MNSTSIEFLDLNIQDLLTYEIANNWFCQFIATDWMQDIVAKRMAKKVQRKYEKFKRFQEIIKHVNVGW